MAANCPSALSSLFELDEQLKPHVRQIAHSPLFSFMNKIPPPKRSSVLHVVNVVSSMKIRSTLVLMDDTAPPGEALMQSWNKHLEM